MVRERMYQGFGLFLALVLAGVLSAQLGRPVPVALAAPQLPGTATDQLGSAAAALDAALAKGGSGLTFEAIQTNYVRAKRGGPLIGVRDPADPAKVVAEVDEFAVNTAIARGAVTADAFWMELRLSPPTDKPDFGAAAIFSRVLVRGGVIWRDDGDGWYQTDVSPGMGMDPVSARLLPKLLRSMTDAGILTPELRDGRLLAGVRGEAVVDDYPGVVASDGKSFTSPAFEIRYWLDDAGRLVRLETTADNLNESEYAHVSDTIVTFGYGSTGDPPEPSPTMDTEAFSKAAIEALEVRP